MERTNSINEFVLDKCINAIPEKSTDLYKYYNEYTQISGSSSSLKSFKRECRRIFSIYQSLKNKMDSYKSEGETSRTTKPDGIIESEIVSNHLITNKEEMAKFCNIDIRDYKEPKIVTNRWGNAENPNWQFKVTWIPKYDTNKELKPREAKKIFLECLKDFKHKETKVVPINEDGRTVEINLPDLHMGQLALSKETGIKNGDYDLNIAKDTFLRAIDYYCNYYRNRKVKKFIFPLGSDLFNVNSNMSTINGTLQEECTKPKETFKTVLETMLIVVDKLSDIAPVDIIFIPGNHDSDVAFYLDCALDVAYRGNKNIHVDTRQTDRKYIKIGNTLLGLTHGKTKGKAIPLENLNSIMADEASDLWSQCRYREFHIGHLHHKKTINTTLEDEFRGTIVRVLSSLSQIDYWHHSSGYRGTRQAEAFEYDEKLGLCSIIIYRD